jgi:ABC-2 type transport system ATP-binding protein
MQDQIVISIEGLRKFYGAVKAVDGISFQIQAGEIFGMVGPNGSGKTTTIECIEGLRHPDEGIVRVLGLDPQQEIYALRERTGIQLQSSNLPQRMRVEEALDLFASFYKKSIDWKVLMEELGLADRRRAYYSQLSGGQKQRLCIALALINQPKIVFLDELTTGLDPQARHAIWDLVMEIRARGTTVFLTTHFMDEAEHLCDRVSILNQGRIIALDTPAALVARLGMETRITFSLNNQPQSLPVGKREKISVEDFNPALIGIIDGVQRVEREGKEIIVYGHGSGLIGAVVST